MTSILVKRINNDKKSSQNAKKNSQTESLYVLEIGDERMPLNNRLKEYRARIGVNQQAMGELVGASRQTISQIERGDYSPSVTLALKIAKVCKVTVEDIFTYEEDQDNG